MNYYQVRETNNSAYPIIIMATTYYNPLMVLEEIEEELRDKSSGKVLFDLLLCNGYSINRFLEAEFSESRFDKCSFKPVSAKVIDSNLHDEFEKFYRDHIELIEDSVLSEIDKYWLSRSRGSSGDM